MSKNYDLIEHLVFKFNQGTITPAELQELTDWYINHNDESVTITTEFDNADLVKFRMMGAISEKIKRETSGSSLKIRRTYRWVSAVAAVFFLVALGAWIWTINQADLNKQEQLVVQEILPGSNKATLILADGTEIALNDTKAGIVSGKDVRYANGKSVGAGMSLAEGTQLFTLSTPKGGTYKITLPDGTQAWLNASSRLKYPSSFSDEQRGVELEGEAYFEVKAAYRPDGSRIPFRVLAGQQQVEVLGTKFNVNCYKDEAATKTTLAEGKVAVNALSRQIVLQPNQQAITSGTKTVIKQVVSKHYTTWHEGKFSFDGKTLQETLQEIGRWYNLDVVYEKEIPNEELIGDAFRNQNIHFVLRFLEVAEINYQLDVNQRKLIIKGKK